jgi:hypothetical protein
MKVKLILPALTEAVIRARRAGALLPALEAILSEFGRRAPGACGPRGRAVGTALRMPWVQSR